MLKLLEKEKCLFTSEIISRLKKGDECKSYMPKRLAQMIKYNEIKFVEITVKNLPQVMIDHPELKPHIDNRMKNENWKVRRASYLYFL